MLKILHVVTSFGMGGAERVAFSLATELARHHDVLVVGIFGVQPAYETIRQENLRLLAAGGVKTIEIGLRGKGPQMLGALARLGRAIRNFGPHIVHSHTDIPDFFVSLVRRAMPFTQARTIHNTVLWPGRTIIPRMVEGRFRDDLVVCVGEGAKVAYLALRARLGLPASNFVDVVPNGIVPPEESDLRAKAQAETILGLAPDRLRLGFVGRMDRQKGLDLLLDAVERLEGGARQIEVHVIGDGPERNALEARAAGLPVRFHGARADARRLMAAFDLMIVPSRYEGFPTVALEARMAGVPTLMSDAPGICDVPTTHEMLRVPAEDPAALTHALRLCLEKLPELNAGAEAQISAAQQAYSAARMARDYEALYGTYLARDSGARP
ncbi:glycosyltransferase [Aquabacter sp. CN5-332]|uniref:glycosyltransferase n=1 Tax=Aquabacter sp. CN5-332 TaxID=3156608 RepID=UPI0032B39440